MALQLNFYTDTSLPATLTATSIYFIKSTGSSKTTCYITDSAGNAYPLTITDAFVQTVNDSVIPDGNGNISLQLSMDNNGGLSFTGNSETIDLDARFRKNADLISFLTDLSNKPTTIEGYGITNAVTNIQGVPAIMSGADSAKPTTGTETGTFYISNDTKSLYSYNGASWVLLSTNEYGLIGTIATATTSPSGTEVTGNGYNFSDAILTAAQSDDVILTNFKDSTNTAITIPEGTNGGGVYKQSDGSWSFSPVKVNLAGVQMQSTLKADGIAAGLVDNTQLYNTSVILPNMTGAQSFGAVLLANNTPALVSGKLIKIKFTSVQTGTARFQILERQTFNNNPPAANAFDTFKGLAIFEIDNVQSGTFEYDLPVPIDIEAGQFVSMICGTGYVNAVYSTGTPTGWWQQVAGPISGTASLIYQTGTLKLGFTVQSDKFAPLTTPTPVINKITATRNEANYNSIRDIVTAITDATELNQYEIHVPAGEWFEIDWQGKQFVKIVGENRFSTIIYMDGTDATKTIPSDYSFPSEVGKTIAAASQIYKHIIFAKNDIWVENLTFKANTAKYAIHLDSNTYSTSNIVDCNIIDAGSCNYALGIGMHAGQYLYFKNCALQRTLPSVNLAMFIHNYNNQNIAAITQMDGCFFKGCGYAMVDELGSDQDDRFILNNCQTDYLAEVQVMVDHTTDGKTYYINPDTGTNEPDPTKVPYCLQIEAIRTKIDYVHQQVHFNDTYPGSQRPDILNHIVCDYFDIANVLAAEVIHIGDLLATDLGYNTTNVTKLTDLSSQLAIGVALENNQADEANPIANTSIKYAPVGKYAQANVNGSILNSTAKKLKYNTATGAFESDPTNAAPYAITLDGKAASSIALIGVKLLCQKLF